MKQKLFFFFFLCAILVAAVGSAFVHDALFISPNAKATPIEVTIAQGSSVNTIASQLQKAHLVMHPLFFKWFVGFSHTQTKLQAGTFSFLPNTSIATIVLVMANPQSTEIKITIPEGYTAKQIKEKMFAVLPGLDQTEWDRYVGGRSLSDFSEEILSGVPLNAGLEGYLFPDTYRFSKKASAEQVIGKMIGTLQTRFVESGEVIPPNLRFQNGMTLHEVLTMASLIEKEVQTPEDMKHVAGVFFNRLKIGMPLQTDTSGYTYKNKGLPPEPINNPGMNAILAVLHPIQTDDLYFITLPNKPAVYAKTFQEHILNQQKYLK